MHPLLSSADILCLQEHHLCNEIKEFLSTINTDFDANVVLCNENDNNLESKLRKGGIAILWKKSLGYCISDVVLGFTTDRIMGICVQSKNVMPLYIFNVYMPTTNLSIDDYRDHISMLQLVYDEFSQRGHIIIMGDFNAQLGPDCGVRSGPRQSIRGNQLYEFILYNDAFSLVTDSICTGPVFTYGCDSSTPSQIDHIIIHRSMLYTIKCCNVDNYITCNTSDHLPVSVTLRRDIPHYESSSRVTYNWNRCDLDHYKATLSNRLDEMLKDLCLHNPNDIDTYLHVLQQTILSVTELTVPKCEFKPYKRPYWDDELNSAHSQQKALRIVWIEQGRPRGMQHLSFSSYKKAKDIFRNILRKKQDAYNTTKFNDIDAKFDMDTQTIWKFLRQQKGHSNSLFALSHNGNMYVSPSEQRQLWHDHFCQLLNEQSQEASHFDNGFKMLIEEKVASMNETFSKHSDPTGVLDNVFSECEIQATCQGLPNKKASGHDLISYENLKYGPELLYYHLGQLYNAIIRHVYVPKSLKLSIIVPLYKGKRKPKNDVNSYRGVSLTPIINKVLEKLIWNRLSPWLSEAHFPPDLQFAGKKGCDSTLLSYTAQEVINHNCANNSKVYGCFLDIKQAFDTIWWQGLLYKFTRIGITDKLWFLFKEWLEGSTCSILLDGVTSKQFNISRSIKQGGLLSMFFFTVAYHDIHQYMQKTSDGLTYYGKDVSSLTLADDTLLLSYTVNGLQRMIDQASQYGRQWRLVFSAPKTKCITFGESKKCNKSNTAIRHWSMNNVKIAEVDNYTHVGINICSYNSSRERSQMMSKRGLSVLGALNSYGLSVNGLSPLTCCHIWKRVCIPSMLFGCQVWGNTPHPELIKFERVLKLASKIFQGYHRRTHDEIARGTLGLYSIEGYIDKSKLSFLRRLVCADVGSITKHIFMHQLYNSLMKTSESHANITTDLILVTKKYSVYNHLFSYVCGGSFPSKIPWKSIISEQIHLVEEAKWTNNLIKKGAVYFNNTQPCLKPSIIYKVIKRDLFNKDKYMLLLQLLTLPRLDLPLACVLCNNYMYNVVEHMLINCTILIERNNFWDSLSDCLSIHAESDLFNMEDQKIVYIMLGKSWKYLDKDIDAMCAFYSNVAHFAWQITQKYASSGITLHAIFGEILRM